MQKNHNNKTTEILNTNINELSKIIDADIVIGKAIKTQNGALVIPISKITLGYLGGNGEYGEVKLFSKSNSKPSASGGGAIVNINPTGFLFVDNNECKFIKASEDTIDKVFDKTTEFISKALNE